MVKKQQKNKKGVELVAAGALLAAAAGYYFLYGSKQAKQNRAKVKSWALKARADIMDQLEKTKVVSEKEFNTVVGKITKKYRQIQNVDPKELEQLARELKSHWKSIQKDIKKRSQTVLKGKKK